MKAIKTKVAASSKYTMYYPSLPIFKSDPSKNRKALYQGSYLGIENVDYSEIEIKNETTKDETIDPKVYYDYFEKEKDKFSAGFLFKLSDSSTFKILVSSEKDSATTANKVESLRKYLFGDVKSVSKKMGVSRDNIGNEIVDLSEQMDQNDQRLYRLVIEADGRLTDNYVDCAEFVYNILYQKKIIIPSGGCNEQFTLFKMQGFDYGSSVSDIKKGDVLFWYNPDGSSDFLAHTGIAVQDYSNTYVPIIQSGRNGCNCDKYSYPVYQKDADGNILLDKIIYNTISDCDQECINNSKFSIKKLSSYVNSEGTAISANGNIDLKFKYWVRIKKK